MNVFAEELTRGLPDGTQLVRVIIRLMTALLVGAIIGLQREFAGKPAGLRTHMLVAMGSALFVLGCSSVEMSLEGQSRVIQGIATGIGFIGAGAILKREKQREIEGLTTASGIWVTSAAGVAVGHGEIGLALLGVAMTWIVLAVIWRIEATIEVKEKADRETP